jgi:hypothetical protein
VTIILRRGAINDLCCLIGYITPHPGSNIAPQNPRHIRVVNEIFDDRDGQRSRGTS